MTDRELIVRVLSAQSAQNEKLEQIATHVSELHVLFHGPAGESEKGIPVRVDRLEQTEKRRARLIWLLIGSVVGLFVQAVGSFTGWIKS